MSVTEQVIEAAIGCAVAIVLLVSFTELPTVIGVALGVLIGIVLARLIGVWHRPRPSRVTGV
jgi:hypothetical protein